MKRFIYPFVIVIAIIVAIASCKKDRFTIDDALKGEQDLIALEDSLNRASTILNDSHNRAMILLRDSLERTGGVITYSVNVVNAGDAGFSGKSGKGGSLSGATITVSQYGQAITKTSDVTGIVVFNDLRIGNASVSITATDFTSVNFIADLTPLYDPNFQITSYSIREAATLVPVFPLTGSSLTTISGKVTLETDLTNNTPEDASDLAVVASVDMDKDSNSDGTTDFAERFLKGNSDAGQIISISYSNFVNRVTTGTDGLYSGLEFPSCANGIPVKIAVEDYATNQTLYLNQLGGQSVTGSQAIRTIFSTYYDGTTANPTAVPVVPPLYVEFSAPTGAVSAPTTPAEATVIVSPDGAIEFIEITDHGSGYTQAPRVVFTSTDGTGATATATISGGKVTGVTVTAGGTGYTEANTTVGLTQHDGNDAGNITVNMQYSVTGATQDAAGSDYESAPDVEFIGGGGSGAAATANILGYLDNVTGAITSAGSGYEVGHEPDMVVYGGDYTTEAALTPYWTGPLGETSFDDSPYTGPDGDAGFFNTNGTGFLLRVDGQSGGISTEWIDGSGGTVSHTLENSGQIRNVTITAGGINYVVSEALIASDGGAFAGHVTSVDGVTGAITGVTVTNNGGTAANYTAGTVVSVSTVGGSGAILGHDLWAQVATMSINAAGTGYYIDHDIEYSTDGGSSWNDFASASYSTEASATTGLSLSALQITNAGAGYPYTNVPSVLFDEEIGYTGTKPVVTFVTSNMRYSVASLTITNEGSGYTEVPIIRITGGGMTEDGNKAKYTAVLGKDLVKSVTLTNPGSGYTVAPVCKFTGGGLDVHNQATLTATLSGDGIGSFTVTDGPEYYTGTPAVSIEIYDQAAAGVESASQGEIEAIQVTNHGAGYTVAPIVEIVDFQGSGATATANIADGRVVSIDVTNPGIGYSVSAYVNLITPGKEKTAIGYPTFDDKGFVTGVNVTDGGEAYIAVPTVTFYNFATGAAVTGEVAGTAEIDNGSVFNVKITNMGTGYTIQNYPGQSFNAAGNPNPLTNPTSAGKPAVVYNGGASFDALGGRPIVKDVYLGTGKRTVE